MTTMPSPNPSLVASLERLARTELSFRARVAYVLLALTASAMTIVVMSLWLTEPTLPRRTAIAFATMTVIGLAWVAYSIWVLSARRVMLARHRVVAGRLAVAFTSVFSAGCILLTFTPIGSRAWPACVMSFVLLAIALVFWRRAERAYATLLTRRDTLERELARSAR